MALNNKTEPYQGKVIASANDEANIKLPGRPTASCCTSKDNMMGKGVKSAMNDLVVDELLAMIEESLVYILRKLLYNAWNDIHSLNHV